MISFYYLLFKSKDLWSGNTPDTSGLTGLSYVGGVCTSSSKYVIVEEIGGFAHLVVSETLKISI